MTKAFLRLLTVSFVCSSLWAYGQVSVTDPDNIFPPPPCDQQTRPVMPFQDCPGAIWVRQPQQYVSTASVLGPGCSARELPSQGNTCLAGNERRTVWLLFEVFPKPGGSTAKGAPAGRLRFRIIPNDVVPQVLPQDEGNTVQGNTDYDFALFDVTGFAESGDACTAVKAATTAGSPASIQKACNYFGYPGATGMSDAGLNYSVDDNRYCLPIPVFVGQIFALAVDNFSLNANGFTLDFDIEAGNGQPSARIVPEAHAIAMNSVQVGTCRNILEVEYSQELPVASVQPAGFSYEAGGHMRAPSAIAPLAASHLGTQARRFALLFEDALPTGTGTLLTLRPLADRYGNQAPAGQEAAYIEAPLRITGIPAGAICPKDTVKLDAQTTDPLANEGFWSSLTPGELIQTGHHARFIPAVGFAGQASLVYSFSSLGGCTDSMVIGFTVSERANAPAIASNGVHIFSSIPGRSQWMRGDSVINISRYDTLQNPTPGLYRVRSLAGDCPTAWSAPFAIGITAVKQVDDFSLAVYPNPVKNLLHVDMMSLGRLGLAEIEVLSPSGTRMRKYRVNSDTEYATKAIPVEGFARGLYTVRVATSGTLMAQKVFISQ